MNKGTIVIVEGPRGSGKTPISNVLEKTNFVKYDCIFVPPDYGKYDGLINWNSPEQSYGEVMAISNVYSTGCNIVMDRSVISWCVYNCYPGIDECRDRITDWVNVLSKWACPIVVCLDADESLLECNVNKIKDKFPWKKGFSWNPNEAKIYRDMYDFIPPSMKLYYKVVDYNANWIFDIESQMSKRMLNSNTFHKIRRYIKI